MLQDTFELLQQQHDFLLSLGGTDFIHQLRAWIDFLAARPQVQQLVTEMEIDGLKLLESHVSYDDDRIARLDDWRKRFAALAPSADDTLPEWAGVDDTDGYFSLKKFDRIIRPSRESPLVMHLDSHKDESRTEKLLEILGVKLDEARYVGGDSSKPNEPTRTRLKPLAAELTKIKNAHAVVHRKFVDAARTSGSVALLQLKAELELAHSDLYRHLTTAFEGTRPVIAPLFHEGSIAHYLYGAETMPRSQKPDPLEKVEGTLRTLARRVHEELMLRLGSIRSLRSTVERFRTRCEWHDRERMSKLAGRKPRTAEAALAAELARWLFDQGWSPISQATMGALRPDLLDLSLTPNLYVEAKQYQKADREYLIKGIRQMVDTMHTLQVKPFDVREGYYAVFRRDGALCRFPERVVIGDLMIHIILVDLAPPAKIGSRAKHQPMVFTESDFVTSSRT